MTWRSCSCLSQSRLFAPQHFCECWSARHLLWLSYSQLNGKKYIFCPFIFCNFRHYYCFCFDQSLLCLAALSLSSSLRLTLLLVLCAISSLRSFSSWFMLPSDSPLQTQSFCLAALRNQLFCIYFIAIWAFSDLFFLVSSSFYLFFSIMGLLLKITPIFWCIFHIQTRANTLFFPFFFFFWGGDLCWEKRVNMNGWTTVTVGVQ